ncbi:MAG: hypothetical protein N3E40_01405, partial [Dehalococcoidia bacterium]|nr:hypothetical protein [Dehalococcoidia bacterium]
FYESLRLTPPPSHYNVGELMHFRGYVHPSRTAILNEIQSDYAQGWSKYRDVPAPPELTRWYIPAGESVLRWAADMPFSRVLIPERAAQESTRYGAKLPFYDDIIDYLSKRSAELGAPTRMEPIGGYLEPSLSKYYNYRGFLIELPESVKDAIRRTAKFGLAPLSLLPVYDEFRH